MCLLHVCVVRYVHRSRMSPCIGTTCKRLGNLTLRYLRTLMTMVQLICLHACQVSREVNSRYTSRGLGGTSQQNDCLLLLLRSATESNPLLCRPALVTDMRPHIGGQECNKHRSELFFTQALIGPALGYQTAGCRPHSYAALMQTIPRCAIAMRLECYICCPGRNVYRCL